MEVIVLFLALFQSVAPEPESRIVEYLKANVTSGQRVIVSDLYNNVFQTPEERAALNRLFNTFFKIPLYAAQYQIAASKPPTLAEIAEQFQFQIPGQADLMLRVMESDPRMPKFLERDPGTGEILRVDVDAVLKHPRFGKELERSIAGWHGRPAPAFATTAYDGKPVTSASLASKPHLLYFWFTNCPPCVKTSPLLAELYETYRADGFEIVALNADRTLELTVSDAERADYAKKAGLTFILAHVTPELQRSYGAVSVFPTLFFVDKRGTIVEHFVNFQEKAALDAAVRVSLE